MFDRSRFRRLRGCRQTGERSSMTSPSRYGRWRCPAARNHWIAMPLWPFRLAQRSVRERRLSRRRLPRCPGSVPRPLRGKHSRCRCCRRLGSTHFSTTSITAAHAAAMAPTCGSIGIGHQARGESRSMCRALLAERLSDSKRCELTGAARRRDDFEQVIPCRQRTEGQIDLMGRASIAVCHRHVEHLAPATIQDSRGR